MGEITISVFLQFYYLSTSLLECCRHVKTSPTPAIITFNVFKPYPGNTWPDSEVEAE